MKIVGRVYPGRGRGAAITGIMAGEGGAKGSIGRPGSKKVPPERRGGGQQDLET
jgi:hypothetical protein